MTDQANQTPPRLAYYADDFTGSTDALQVLARAGLRARLFLTAPSAERLAELPTLDAIGVAGRSRSMATPDLEGELRPAFQALRALGPRHVHYKVCSTFDSSPSVGSIGRVMEIGGDVFPGGFIPLVVGAPTLGRWCVFGNLFARYGIGSAGEVFRLDRHPAMRRHPVTPAHESDLRQHLAEQTSLRVELLDVTRLEQPLEQCEQRLESLVQRGADAVLMDVYNNDHLLRIGELLERAADRSAQNGAPLFSVGSSGVEMALVARRLAEGETPAPPSAPYPGDAPVLVLSGSCSPVTAAQIQFSLGHAFADVPLDTPRLLDPRRSAQSIQVATEAAAAKLRAGQSVIVHTSRGPDDPRCDATTSAARQASLSADAIAQAVGGALGEIAIGCRQAARVERVCVAGGDSSSYAGRTMRIESLAVCDLFLPGAPVCLASSSHPDIDGLQVIFKGGQVGGPHFFSNICSDTLATGEPHENQ